MKHRINTKKKYKIIELYYEGASAKSLCREYNISRSTLYKWIADHPQESMIRAKLKKEKPVSISRMVSHTEKIESEIDFLHHVAIAQIPLKERMNMIDKDYGKRSLRAQCDALEVNRATYLNHRNRNKNEDAWFIKREAEYTEYIRKIYEDSGHVYGSKKITAIMKKNGKPVTRQYVSRIMRRSGMISIRSPINITRRLAKKNMHGTNYSNTPFKTDAPNKTWSSDVTAICIHNHYYYICVYIDLFSRKAVGHSIGRNGSVQLVKRAFIKAYNDRHPKNLTVHTDNAAVYTSYSYNKMLQERDVQHSYSRPGIPHDNAVAESFFNSLKSESIMRENYPNSFRELKERVEEYMRWYNSERSHEYLKYVSPDVYEKLNKIRPNKLKK